MVSVVSMRGFKKHLVAYTTLAALVGTLSAAFYAHMDTHEAREVGVRYACDFPGEDIGQQINAAIADLPVTGGDVMIPAGTREFSTTIDFGERSRVRLIGRGGKTPTAWRAQATHLVYTSNGTAIQVGHGKEAKTECNVLMDFAVQLTKEGSVGVEIKYSPVGRMDNFTVIGKPRSRPFPGLFSGNATGATKNTLFDTGQDFTSSTLAVGMHVAILHGRGRGQVRKIAAITATQLTFEKNWIVIPDDTSEYKAGVTVGINATTTCNGWDLFVTAVKGCGVGCRTYGAHGWNLWGFNTDANDIGLVIEKAGNFSIFGGDFEQDRVSSIEVMGMDVINITGAYFESSRMPYVDAKVIRLGCPNGSMPSVVNITNNRFQRGGSGAPYYIEMNRVQTANISNNWVRGIKGGAFILNNGGSHVKNVTVLGNYVKYHPALITDAEGKPNYAGVVRLHDLDTGLFITPDTGNE